MSQQINLLNPSLIKQKDFFNATNIAITLGLLSALMFGYYGYAQKQLSLLTIRRNQISEDLKATQMQLKQVALLHAPREVNKTLLEQIAQLEQKEAMQQQILQTVNQNSATPEKGYAALMRAFAKQSLDNLWLTSFNIDSSNDKLNISGRTIQAELVPEYISRLGNEPSLKGKSFSALNMTLPKSDHLANNPVPAVISPVTTTTIVKNGVSVTPTNSASSVATNQKNDPKYIEFTLQSTDEKLVSSTIDAKAGSKL
jgi:hypothetical protein